MSKLTNILHIIIGTLLLLLGVVLNPVNHYIMGLVLMVGAVVLYFYIVFKIADKNWLDIRAVFAGVWLFTIGLAALRLLEYQEIWQTWTWIYNALAFFMFQIGAMFGKTVWNKIYERIEKIHFKRIYFKMEDNRLFAICVGVTLVGFVCFCINVYIRGFIPFFSSDPTAYITFYTRFHVFAVASTMISGLCYYCIKTQKIALWKKVILGICILYATFLFPTLVVSRGTFITSALSLATTIFYLHKKKLSALIVSLFFIMGIYMLLSTFRGYSDAQLKVFFEPSEISITDVSKKDTSSKKSNKKTDKKSNKVKETEVEETDIQEESKEVVFSLPPKVAFLYSYLTVSHDNFNEGVQNVTKHTYGVYELEPFNVILRNSKLEKTLDESKIYLVRDHLNTWNLIGAFYYDFSGFGIAFFMLVWGIVFSTVQACYLQTQGPIALYTLGNTMVPVALSFFASWTCEFSQWMHWGTGLIIWLIACVHLKKKS